MQLCASSWLLIRSKVQHVNVLYHGGSTIWIGGALVGDVWCVSWQYFLILQIMSINNLKKICPTECTSLSQLTKKSQEITCSFRACELVVTNNKDVPLLFWGIIPLFYTFSFNYRLIILFWIDSYLFFITHSCFCPFDHSTFITISSPTWPIS